VATLPETKNIPYQEEKVLSEDHKQLGEYLKLMVRIHREMYEEISTTANLNEKPEYVAQDDQPTPEKGKLIIWKDTDAGAGNPTHYLVYNDGGTVRTWGSDQVV